MPGIVKHQYHRDEGEHRPPRLFFARQMPKWIKICFYLKNAQIQTGFDHD